MERNAAPTEERLATLRAEGNVPVSSMSVRAISIALFLVSLIWLAAVVSEFTDHFLKSLNQPLFSIGIEKKFQFLFWKLCLALAFGSGGAMLVGFLQTSFMLRLGNSMPRFDRLGLGSKGDLKSESRSIKLAALVLLPIGGLIAAAAVLFLFTGEAFKIFNADSLSLLKYLSLLFKQLALVSICGLGFFTVVSWLVVRYRFMLKHRMSKQEIEEEAKHK